MSSLSSEKVVTIDSIRDAASRISPHVHRTPVLTSDTLDRLSGRQLFFKCELFQKTGSFKIRGATNAVLMLSPDIRNVVTHSSGNHAQAVSQAARTKGIAAHIVMPNNAPAVKRAAVQDYGGIITLSEPTNESRQTTADALCQELSAAFIHPSNDPNVISGQGTVGLELLEQARELGGAPLDALIIPIGGGGLCGGIATAAKALQPNIRIFAAEPLAANDAARSKTAGRLLGHDTPPHTIADGLKTCLGSNTWPVVRDLVEEVVCVSEEEIAAAMRLVWERMKLVIEPSAAVGVAVAISPEFRARSGMERVGIVFCGGNSDLDKLPWLVAQHAKQEGGDPAASDSS